MPQLDKITFLSQVFWLLLIFLSFYLITLRFLLPTISQILKIRRKKLESDSKQLTNFKEEESLVTEHYESVLRNSFIECQKLLMEALDSSLRWLDTSLKKTNESTLLEMNREYIKTVGEISGKKHLIQSCVHKTKTV
jgi:F0F1-type ATP synthase membrane subunit b/b'